MTDLARGFLALATTPGIEGRDINICTGTEVSMQYTLDTIARLMKSDVKYVVDPERIRPSKSEVMRLCGDNTLIESLTAWRPQVSFEEGIQRCIDWYTVPGNLAKYKTDIYNR